MRLKEARLQAESSRNMYSEQGLEALMRPELVTGFQRLTVVSYCSPGSPHSQAAWDIRRIRSRARKVSTAWPSVTARVCHSPSSTTARMKSSVTRTLLLAFWKKMEL